MQGEKCLQCSFLHRCGLPLDIKFAMLKSELREETDRFLSNILKKNPELSRLLEKLIGKEVEEKFKELIKSYRGKAITSRKQEGKFILIFRIFSQYVFSTNFIQYGVSFKISWNSLSSKLKSLSSKFMSIMRNMDNNQFRVLHVVSLE